MGIVIKPSQKWLGFFLKIELISNGLVLLTYHFILNKQMIYLINAVIISKYICT